MIQVKTILCPTDGSPFAEGALRHAIVLARWFGAEIAATHVYEAPPVALGRIAGPRLSIDDAELARVEDELKRFLAPATEAGLPTSLRVAIGDPVDEILRMAESIPADLVVMGTHGRSFYERLVIGSVTEKLLRRCAMPVIAVPAPKHHPVEARQILFETIVCAVDFSPASLRALDYAFWLAKLAKGRLVLVHVLEQFAGAGSTDETPFDVSDYRQSLEATAGERLRAVFADYQEPELKPDFVVVTGRAGPQIARLAAEREAGLVVMGVVGRGAVDLTLFGSAANHLVRTATCPVLTIRM